MLSPLSHKPQSVVQAKLTIGQPGDKYEQEADTIADQVMRMPQTESPIQRKCAECEEEDLQMKPLSNSISPIVQMQVEEEEEQLQMKSEGGQPQATPSLTAQLNSSKGGGNNLPESTSQFMGNAFGADFSGVKVHTDSNAIQMNRSLGARAFTNGSDVYFNKGEYNPNSGSGKHLLAHELTHVVQQRGGITPMVQKLDHVADTGYRYTPPASVTRSIAEIQAVVGTNPDGVYGINTKTAVERYQTKLTAIGFYTDTIEGKWGTNTDVAHEAFATGPNQERKDYNCAGFAFKRYTFIGLPATRAIYAGMTNLNDCSDSCLPWHHKFWMWEFDTFTEDIRTGARSGITHDFHTVGGQTNSTGADPNQVMSKDGPRPIVGPGAPLSFRPLAREHVVLTDGSRHPFFVWHVFNIDQKCFCSENLP